MAARKRTLTVTIRVTELERSMLAELADHTGLSQSDIVRQAIRHQHAEVFGPPTPPKRRKKR